MLKMAVFAPIPIAIVKTATSVKPGFRISVRKAYRRSLRINPVMSDNQPDLPDPPDLPNRPDPPDRPDLPDLPDPPDLLVSERLHRRDPRRPVRRNVARQQRDRAQNDHDPAERDRVGPSRLVQQRRQRPPEHQCEHHTGAKSDRRQAHRPSDNHPDDVRGFRAEGKPDPDLRRA